MDLIGREIFAVGTWNGLEFTESDLDDVVANFESLGENHKVPLKLGHNEDQKVTDGQPALGWVSKIYKHGQKLLADFTDMPSVIYDAMMKKLYRTVSVELLFNVDHKGTKYNHVLDAVAILGADQPAVNTLSDLNALLASRISFAGGTRQCFDTMAGNGPKLEESDMGMSKEEVQELLNTSLAPLKAEAEELRAENKTLKAKAEADRLEKEDYARKEAAKKVTMAREAVTTILDDAVKAKSMTPALRETYAKQIGVDDDARVIEIDVDQVKLMCGAVKGEDQGESGRVGDNEQVDDAGEELLRLTRKAMAATGDDNFNATFSRVAAANPELHKEYLDSNGEK